MHGSRVNYVAKLKLKKLFFQKKKIVGRRFLSRLGV